MRLFYWTGFAQAPAGTVTSCRERERVPGTPEDRSPIYPTRLLITHPA